MSQKIPNILYIMADDHAANAISLYGSRLASVFKTPNIDRIGHEGAIIKNCFCTNSICTPSRATILTGQYSHTNGVKTLKDSLDTKKNTYPQMLQKNGYQTALVGKWHVHSKPQGFDYYDILPGQGHYFDPEFIDQDIEWIEGGHSETTSPGGYSGYPEKRKSYRGHSTDIITDKSLDWLEETRNENNPFMLMCHYKAPHGPWRYHPRYENLFYNIEIPEPDSLWEDKSHRSAGSRNFGRIISNMIENFQSDYPTGSVDFSGLNNREKISLAYQKYLKDYLRCCKGIDDNVGRLLDYLDKNGLSENTIVIYTSDQGMFLGEHNYSDKRWIFEESLRMPFLIRYPEEIEAGLKIDDTVSNVDFAPTFLDYAGLEKTEAIEGKSFREVVKGKTPVDWSNKLYYRYWMHMACNIPAHYGIRTKDYKLIFYYGLPLDAAGAFSELTPAAWELYDLKNDPNELNNVYNDSSYANIVEKLKQQLFSMKKELGDTDNKYPELMRRQIL